MYQCIRNSLEFLICHFVGLQLDHIMVVLHVTPWMMMSLALTRWLGGDGI